MKHLAILILLISNAVSAADALRVRYVDPLFGVVMSATAFPIEKRVLMTACHCVVYGDPEWNAPERAEQGQVEIAGEWVPFKVKKIDRKIDAALIEVEQDLPSVCELGDDATDGQKCTIEGSYDGQPITTEKAKMKGAWDERPSLSICETKRLYFGKSGGPVLSGGKVVGMVVRGVKAKDGKTMRQDRAVFVPVSALKTLCDDLPKPAPKVEASPQKCVLK